MKPLFFILLALSTLQITTLESFILAYDALRGTLTSLFADINQGKSALCMEELSGLTTITRAIESITNGTATAKTAILSILEIITVSVGGYYDCQDIVNGFRGILDKISTISNSAANDPTAFMAKLGLMFVTEITTINYAISKIKEYYYAGNYFSIGLQIGDTFASFFIKLFP